MSKLPARIGVDYRHGTVYAARVEFDQEKPRIKGTLELNRQSQSGHLLMENGRIVLPVPDREAIVKRIQVERDETVESQPRSRFELDRMLLEDEQLFYFDFIETDLSETTLGIIMRKENLASLAEAQWLAPIISGQTPDYRMRAVALGKAYLNFCQRQEDNLICLIDFNGPQMSVSLTLNDSIVGMTSLKLPEANDDTIQTWERVASELRTAVNFQLSSLSTLSETSEISKILITGLDVNGVAADCLRKYFPKGVSTPQLDTTLQGDIAFKDEAELGNYLIALGLTVDWACPGQN